MSVGHADPSRTVLQREVLYGRGIGGVVVPAHCLGAHCGSAGVRVNGSLVVVAVESVVIVALQ